MECFGFRDRGFGTQQPLRNQGLGFRGVGLMSAPGMGKNVYQTGREKQSWPRFGGANKELSQKGCSGPRPNPLPLILNLPHPS